jgi:hypothetical protein
MGTTGELAIVELERNTSRLETRLTYLPVCVTCSDLHHLTIKKTLISEEERGEAAI